ALYDAGHRPGVRPSRRAVGASRRACAQSRRAGGSRAVSLSSPFVRRPVGTTLMTIALVIAGVISFRLLPVAPLPQVDFPTISVVAGPPGASPETTPFGVAAPLERRSGRGAGVAARTALGLV